MAELKIGMKLFHKNQMGVVRECELIRIYQEDGIKKLAVKIPEKIMVTGKDEPTDIFGGIPENAFGKFLFFEEGDTQLPITELANRLDYIDFGNKDIKKICKKKDEEKKEIEIFHKIMKERYENEFQTISKILESRNIKYLIYFTRIENLKSILQYGIIPQKQHSSMKIRATGNKSKKRYDFQVDGNGYSIEFPNYRLLNRFREDGVPTDRYVMLRLSAKDVLLNTIGKQVYCPDNALTSNDKYGDGGLNELFLPAYHKEGYEYEGVYHKEIYVERADLNIPDCYTTNPQAEVEICNIVEPKYIKQVIFENNNDKQLWLERNTKFQNSSVDFIVDAKLFGPRFDWQFWQ